MKLAASCLVIFAWSAVKCVTARSLINTIGNSYEKLDSTHVGRLSPSDVSADVLDLHATQDPSKAATTSQTDQLGKVMKAKDLTRIFGRFFRRPKRNLQNVPRAAEGWLRSNQSCGLENIFHFSEMQSILDGSSNRPDNTDGGVLGNDPENCPSKWSFYDIRVGRDDLSENIFPRYFLRADLTSTDVACKTDTSKTCTGIYRPIVTFEREEQAIHPVEVRIPVGYRCT